MAALLLLLLVFLVFRRLTSGPSVVDEPPNQAPEYSGVIPLRTLQQVSGGWVAEADPSWLGLLYSDDAIEGCKALATRLPFIPSETLTILDTQGLPVVECPLTLDLAVDLIRSSGQ